MYLSRVRLKPSLQRTQLTRLLQDRQGYGLHRLFWDLFRDDNEPSKSRDFLFREEIAAEQLANPGQRKADPVYYVLSISEPDQHNPLFEVAVKPYSPQLTVGERLAFKLRVNAVVHEKITRDSPEQYLRERQQRGVAEPGKLRKKRKRHDLVMHTQQQWLKEQLNLLGADVNGSKSDLKRRLLDLADDQRVQAWQDSIAKGPFSQQLEQQLGRKSTLEWAIKSAVEAAVQAWWQAQGQRLGFEVACDGAGQPMLESVAYQKHHLPEKAQKAGFNSLDLSGEIIVSDVAKFESLLQRGIGPAKAFGCGLMLIRRC